MLKVCSEVFLGSSLSYKLKQWDTNLQSYPGINGEIHPFNLYLSVEQSPNKIKEALRS